MTAVLTRAPVRSLEQQRGPWLTRTIALVLIAAATVAYLVFRGEPAAENTDAAAFRLFTDVRDWVDENRDTHPAFLFGMNYLRLGVRLLTESVSAALTGLGFAGLVAVAGAVSFVLAGWRYALLAVAGFLSFAVLGLWTESVATLSLTLSAVLLSVLIGVPLGVLAARVRWFGAAIRPVLDVMQILPAFAYLAPMTLLFLIGSPAAVVATLIYAVPVTIRITELGIAGVSPTAVEAAAAQGSTRWQLLVKVRLPMARPVLVLAVNQTIMMALSMVVVTALIDAPGLGENIIRALERVNVGAAFDAGLAIVIMAVVLDRVTTAASRRSPIGWRVSVPVLAAAAVVALLPIGDAVPRWSAAEPVNEITAWVELHWYDATEWLRNTVSTVLLNPLETVLTTTPWWLFTLVVVAIGFLAAGWRAALIAGAASAGIAGLGLWAHAMQTLATVLVGTALTLLIGAWAGVLCARHDRLATAVRPLLDAAQTMPSFVYLLPAVALFGASRFTAIVAAVIFAVPPVVRLVERGIRDVPSPVVEAAVSSGSTPRQLLWKVQLPLARPGLLLAANQGIVMVLGMVVVGGLVGAGALGYDVVAGFSQREDFGRGLAAGFAIVLLGILLDRLTPRKAEV
ncbi:glycine/betaine ABC transporter permease [Actinoplanes italicus]|uniref:Glycine betaine/proline transport system permease protein n=1 Tax=Actinoplanes italicus TaxID=113567 RepID=A0A2T0KD99_9ACTN|nr:ABC transporter permease subunit [Actinoplanes italicus]PRX21275.1 glycine betaine/proline transport system permease protein [Actinoplanes italicus]GIE36387.1 glycine/betaine ABC transporter permease [Actinoplanes italicus]